MTQSSRPRLHVPDHPWIESSEDEEGDSEDSAVAGTQGTPKTVEGLSMHTQGSHRPLA